MTNIKAAQLPQSTIAQLVIPFLCKDYINGFCRKGDECTKSHEIWIPLTDTPNSPVVNSPPNYLSLEPRSPSNNELRFDSDGPGSLSRRGQRHDNDHVDIQYIKILPTTDEILCRRPPYMPKKGPYAQHNYPNGQKRLLDIHFRHLRYESTESIIDSIYHAIQQSTQIMAQPQVSDYDDRMVTPKGFRYSLFRYVSFEELLFIDKKSTAVRVSFACPIALRGRRLGLSKHLEEGMLAALVGLDQNSSVSVTFMEIYQRQTTEAMRPRTGNDLRGQYLLPRSSLHHH